ncbi:hypothetical protein FRC11_013922 [Ceratobasidium sp. 423]|nr:hypothetical protein FRC11_013922 [Ceratobasidium sp. 423]
MSVSTRKQHLSYSQKIKILDFYHQHKHRLTQQQAVTRIRVMGFPMFAQSTLSGYLKGESRIREYASARHMHRNHKRKALVRLPQVEEALYTWVMEKQHSGVCLTSGGIREKGREFCRLFNVPDDQVPAFSNGWLSRIKTRFGLGAHKFHTELLPLISSTVNGHADGTPDTEKVAQHEV